MPAWSDRSQARLRALICCGGSISIFAIAPRARNPRLRIALRPVRPPEPDGRGRGGGVTARAPYGSGAFFAACRICGRMSSIPCGEIRRASKPGASGSGMLSFSINST